MNVQSRASASHLPWEASHTRARLTSVICLKLGGKKKSGGFPSLQIVKKDFLRTDNASWAVRHEIGRKKNNLTVGNKIQIRICTAYICTLYSVASYAFG